MADTTDLRREEIHRKTAETEITMRLAVDGSGVGAINTGLPFFDHILTGFSKHGLFDLEVEAEGDLEVDAHHTVEDVGIVLGQCVKKSVGNKIGIQRYGHAYIPMDESLVRVVVDLSGRGHLEARLPDLEPVGAFSFQLVEEFLRAFAINSASTLHVECLYGRNSHHVAEAVFKALGRALDAATRLDVRVRGVPSTKEML